MAYGLKASSCDPLKNHWKQLTTSRMNEVTLQIWDGMKFGIDLPIVFIK